MIYQMWKISEEVWPFANETVFLGIGSMGTKIQEASNFGRAIDR